VPAASDEEALRDRLKAALPAAIKARDRTAVAAIRSAMAAIDNAESVDPAATPPAEAGRIAGGVRGLRAGEVTRRSLSDAEITAVVRSEIEERLEAACAYDALGRTADAARVRAEAAVLDAHIGDN
jgi:hypothetical protein